MPKIHELDVDEYLYESVRIEPLALEEEFVRMSADLAYWNQRYAAAVREHLTSKIAIERTASHLRIIHRERLTAENPKPPTESMVEAAVNTDEQMDKARAALIDAEVEKVRLAGVLDAVRTKRDMLVSLGAHVRAEMQADPSIRSDVAAGRRR
jgi:hypothetical protein